MVFLCVGYDLWGFCACNVGDILGYILAVVGIYVISIFCHVVGFCWYLSKLWYVFYRFCNYKVSQVNYHNKIKYIQQKKHQTPKNKTKNIYTNTQNKDTGVGVTSGSVSGEWRPPDDLEGFRQFQDGLLWCLCCLVETVF